MIGTSTISPLRFFVIYVLAAFAIAALFLFFWSVTVRAQDDAIEGDEIISDEEADAVVDDEAFVAEPETAEDESISAEPADEGGFFSNIANRLRDAGSAIGDVISGALEAVGLGGEEADEEEAAHEEILDEKVEEEAPTVVEDTDVEAPEGAPAGNPFALRVQISSADVRQVIAAMEGGVPTQYEERAFEIPGRGPLTLRAMQDGPLFCLEFDLSGFRQSLAFDAASFIVGERTGVTEEGDVNNACVDLTALSAAQPLTLEATFK